MVVHVFGNPVKDLFKIQKLCKKYSIKLIEDAAEGIGSYIFKNKKKKHIGFIGDFSCFSFNANKVITAGAGGMIYCKSKKDFNFAKYLSSTAKDKSYNFTHNECGYNYRITNLHSAIGFSQLSRLKSILEKKRKITNTYFKLFKNNKNVEFILPDIKNVNCWFNIIRLNSKKNLDKKFEQYMNKKKIETRTIWKPLCNQKFLKKFQKFEILNTDNIIRNCYCIPSNIQMQRKDIEIVCKSINEFSKKYLS